jgi:mgtE-like transporter
VSDTGPKRPFYSSIPAQTLIALLFNTLSLVAGGLISIFTPQFKAAPWILALFPPVLTIRGGIGGIFSGNLATMLHIGLIRPQMRKNTPVYYQLISSIFVITLVDTLIMGGVSFLLNLALGRVSVQHLLVFMVVPPVACVTAMAVSIPLTMMIAIMTFRRGLNPDILVYPILASVNDIVVSTVFVATVFLVLWGGGYTILLWVIFLLILVVTGYIAWRNWRVPFFFKTIKEGATVVVTSSVFGSLNGAFLSGMSAELLRYPGVMVLYPGLTNALGNIGAIIGSTTTTNLALGYIRDLRDEVKASISTIMQVEGVALLIHGFFGLVTYLIVKPSVKAADLASLISVAVLSNLISFIPIALVALAVAHAAYKRGLNPDNVAIPVITTVADTAATLTLFLVLNILDLIGLF